MASGVVVNGESLALWRNVSTIRDDKLVIYYPTPHTLGCIPCIPNSSAKLLRREITQPDVRQRYKNIPDNSFLTGKLVLLIVNPKSGTGDTSAANEKVQTVTEILSEAGLGSVVRFTEHPRHAVEILNEYGAQELGKFAVVASVGGDGTLHEILNGLIEAFQNTSATEIDLSKVPPLAIIPSGSGNAIAVSTGLLSAQHAALNIVHSLRTGESRPLALLRYRCPGRDGIEKYAIGGIQWGFVADVDQGSEWMRCIGSARFGIASLMQIVMKRSYSARVKVTVNREEDERMRVRIANTQKTALKDKSIKPMDRGEQIAEDTYILEGDFVTCVGWNSAFIGEGFMVTPFADVTETGTFDFVVFRAGISRGQLLNILMDCKDGSYIGKTDLYVYYKARCVEFERLNGAYLTLDGESLPVKPFTLEMAPQDGKLRILSSFAP